MAALMFWCLNSIAETVRLALSRRLSARLCAALEYGWPAASAASIAR